ADGYLASVADPAGGTVRLTYAAGGLLSGLTDPRGGTHQFGYDGFGRLVRDQDPAGAVIALARTDVPTGYAVAVTSGEGRTSIYTVEELPTGDRRRTTTEASGLRTVTLIGTDGSRTVTAPDGTVTTWQQGPDPRFGMQAP